MKSFHIITFGCQMNEHDSERMAGMLEAEGRCLSADPASADLVILNTCSIREKAEQKFFSELGRLRSLKEQNPNMKIAVAGCIAQQEGRSILARAPYVDIVFGPSDLAGLPSLVEAANTGREPAVSTKGDPAYHRIQFPTKRTDRIKAWVSIMYGCDNFCTYCVVPYLRGRERSRPAEHIVQEVSRLAAEGCKEVTLLGQNVNSYGKGLEDGADFPKLLGLIQDTGIERIRFMTSHPRDLSDGLIAAVRDLPKVCEAVHLPVQSGSDRVLASMNRRYTRADYLDRITKLRSAVPGIALTTDIIVGFPGESEDDFEDTVQLLTDVRFDNIFAFKYSKRPGTAALRLDGHMGDDVKEQRLAKILELQKEISLQKNRDMIGSVCEVLIDGPSKKGDAVCGRTHTNKVVNVHASADLIGTVARVEITSASLNSLNGTLCG
jgi:tRNA-2-methylthio-N6-dimethylallyladenosine synthase